MGNCLPIFDSAWRKANAAMKVAQFAFAYYSRGTRLGSAGTLTERFGLSLSSVEIFDTNFDQTEELIWLSGVLLTPRDSKQQIRREKSDE